MKYDALGKTWNIAFPFSVQRDLEQKYDKGFYGICRMIAPQASGDVDLKEDPAKLLDMIGDVRVSVLVDLLQSGTEGMDEAQAVEAYEELSLVGTFSLIFRALNPGAEDDASRPAKKPPVKRKTRTKKPAG